MNQYVALLRQNRNYRNLWLANVVTQFGDWFNLLASAELIFSLTNSGLAISFLFLARFLPLFLFSPFAGALADRYSRRGIMIISDLVRAATVLCFLFVRSPDQIWLFYLLTTLQFTMSALFTPTRSALLANVVERKDLVKANALDSLTWSSMLTLGSLAGGLVAAAFGVTTAFVADAFTFLLSAYFVSRIVIPAGVERKKPESNQWGDIIAGFRYLRGHRFILVISLVKAGGSLAWGATNVLEISFAEEVFPLDQVLGRSFDAGSDPGTWSLWMILVASGIGTGLGPILMRRLLGDRPSRLLLGITLSLFCMAAGIAALALAPTLWVFLGATVVRTLGTGTSWVFSGALLQLLVLDRYRGRVFAFEFATLTLTQSISVFSAGYMRDAWGLSLQSITMIMAAVGFVVSFLWLPFYLRNRHTADSMRMEDPSSELPNLPAV